MPIESALSASTLFGFLLVLTRVSGIFAFVPMPGFHNAAAVPRVVASFALAVALLPAVQKVPARPTLGLMILWIAAEAMFGILIGLCVAFLTEGFLLAMQILGLQAGYSYASTVDPTSQADSSILQVAAQLIASLLFFALGIDRAIIRLMAGDLQRQPLGSFATTPAATEALIHLGGQAFVSGLRLALPVVALLLLVDVTLALTGRIHAQLQLLSLAFPAKMLAALALLAAIAGLFPVLYSQAATHTLESLTRMTR
jgi:flagellar biosynthetic protein FliR